MASATGGIVCEASMHNFISDGRRRTPHPRGVCVKGTVDAEAPAPRPDAGQSELVANLANEFAAFGHVLRSLDAFGRTAVHDSQDRAPLFGLRKNHFHGI